ncbi:MULTISPECIES: hypothetical protein [unclassified Leptolyngbya]|uniref:hypothetical protein n=1 Tax=unclassified Leptolyngbya TaxID=2650499 RepID=UPI001689F36B|nr:MULTISPECIES: hypothetical protein [unclassified Leptolyngbya]MBD1911780.1 hypothetical protein [Leptolyngbya sp. FACHB-8]MBD2153330.1 hypothetical protein [Leptolyngbya sp. FACHB-16]
MSANRYTQYNLMTSHTPQFHSSTPRLIAAIALTFLLWLTFIPIAHANSPAPPILNWFEFEGLPGMEAVQVIGCETEECQKPALVAQYGSCTLSGCLAEEPILPDDLRCHETVCLASIGFSPTTKELPPQFRVLVQSGDRLYSSQVIAERAFGAGGDRYWQGRIEEATLVLQKSPSSPRRGQEIVFTKGLLITLATEALVLALALWRLKFDRVMWARTFVSFGLMHSVSYPVVWGLTSALLPFQYRPTQVGGWVCIAIALLYALCIYPLRRAKSWQLILLSVVLLPVAFFLGLLVTFAFSYGNFDISLAGLPYAIALVISEVLVTVYEAGFLAMLSREKLSLRTAGVISLLMNAASLAMGIWFFR